MKGKFLSPLLGLALFLAFACRPIGQPERAFAAAESRAECVIEVNSGRILHEKNAQCPLPMASTTKILTAIIVIEDCDLAEEVTVPREVVGVEGSSVYLKEGEVYTIEELLYGLMLRSGNDCAELLAICHSGSIRNFTKTMNARAAGMGARDSFFANPHGMPHPDHHTTALDLAIISSYAMKNPVFRNIVSCTYYEKRGWKNKNKMLTEYEGGIGVKTGFTTAAGRCLVSCAQRGDMTVLSVVLNSAEMFERSKQLLDDAFSKYTMVKLCSRDEVYAGGRVKQDFFYPLAKQEGRSVRYFYELNGLAENSDDFMGEMKIALENNLIFSQNLYMI